MLLNKFWAAGSRHDDARSSMPLPPDVVYCRLNGMYDRELFLADGRNFDGLQVERCIGVASRS